MEHEKRTETTNSLNTHERMIDYTRIRGEFICKGVVNGGREYGEGCRLSLPLFYFILSLLHYSRSRSFVHVLKCSYSLSINISPLLLCMAVSVSHGLCFHPSSILRSSSPRISSMSVVYARARVFFPSTPSRLSVLLFVSPSLSLFAADFAHSQGWPTMT